jgi:hypothetical protein
MLANGTGIDHVHNLLCAWRRRAHASPEQCWKRSGVPQTLRAKTIRAHCSRVQERLGPAEVAAYINKVADIVNLKRARKLKERGAAAADAAANRITHGRTKAEKKLSRAEAEAASRKLEGHKRNDDT